MDEKEFQKISKKTQDSLGKLIKKPPLTDKLLKKPPFRFLHDIITSVIRMTGFMKGLYTATEMNSENVKEKEAKIAFLQKAIDMVALVTGKVVSVKPNKIVSGHEPEKTNEFLQLLATAILKKVDNDEFVKRVLSSEKPGKSSVTKKDNEKKDDPKEKKRETEGSSRSREGKEKKDLSRERGEKKEQSPGRDDRKDRHKPRDDGKSRRERSRDGRDKENREHSKDRTKEEEKRRHHRDKGNDSAVENEPKVNGKAANIAPASIVIEEGASVAGVDEQPAKIPRPTSAKGSRRRTREGRTLHDTSADEDEDERFRSEVQVPPRDDPETNRQIGEEDLPPQVVASRKMARPPSARPAPPKLKKQNEPISQDPDVRISSGKRVTNVIVDSTRSDEEADDDDDNFIVQDGGTSLEPEPEPLAMRQDEDEVDSGEHGGLVKKILVTKKELEEGSQQSGTKKTGVEKPLVSDAARRKEREMVQREIDKLRVSIQTLTRSANPLGKIMDYVQEDLDSMQKELQKWKMENKDHLLALKQEQSITDNSVEPLKAQLKDLDQTISDQFIQIAAVKAKILRNDEKINKMLGSITKS